MFGDPNITGKLVDNFAGSYGLDSYGAFIPKSTGLQNQNVTDDGKAGFFEFSFSATNSNAIYSGSGVQTSALNVLPCIRI